MIPFPRKTQKLKIVWTGQLYFVSVRWLEVNINQIIEDQAYFKNMPS